VAEAVSRAAASNPDRKRVIQEVEIPPHATALFEPGTRAFRMGACFILLSQQRVGWHMSISKPSKLPTWEEVRDARYALIPDEAVMAMLLPSKDVYVNVHEFCLQLYEVPSEYMNNKDTL
jgi:hypothetical protein